MKIKCGTKEFELNEKDLIMDNGACYQLITRRIGIGYYAQVPVIAKSKAKQLIKEGKLKETKLEKPPFKGNGLKYYSI